MAFIREIMTLLPAITTKTSPISTNGVGAPLLAADTIHTMPKTTAKSEPMAPAEISLCRA
ncbi:MAG: hypothetical protein V8Q36_10110 [Anaerotignum sp.]